MALVKLAILFIGSFGNFQQKIQPKDSILLVSVKSAFTLFKADNKFDCENAFISTCLRI